MVAKHAHVIYHWKGNLPNIRNSTTLVNSLRNITIVLKFIFIFNAFREYNSHLQDITRYFTRFILDILVKSNENKIETSLYYKKTYTGLLTYYFSSTPTVYKSSLVRTLVDSAFKINSSWKTFHLDLKRIKENLQRNSFPIDFIDSRVKCYLDHKIGDTKNRKS